MGDSQPKELKVREKQEVASPAEQTSPGLLFTPAVDIYETEHELMLLADMPGVKADRLSVDLREGTLTLVGEVDPPEGKQEEDVLVEYEVGKFFRQFTLSEVIDQQKIEATLNNGVLRLKLPKVEKAAPRKIEVKAG
jgi:HSP20 family molecular chaperone IbpA